MGTEQWIFDQQGVDWRELSELYRIAPLGEKSAEHLRLVFSNSRFKCFVLDGGKLIAAGRALADGRDCSYLCDIAVAMAKFEDQQHAISAGLVEK